MLLIDDVALNSVIEVSRTAIQKFVINFILED